MCKICQRIGPKGPYRLQKRGKRAKEKDCAAKQTQKHEAANLAVGTAQEEQEGCDAHTQAVNGIQKAGQPGRPMAKGAQQIIQQGEAQPQQNGLGKEEELVGDLIFHLRIYRNSRLRKPPRLGP